MSKKTAAITDKIEGGAKHAGVLVGPDPDSIFAEQIPVAEPSTVFTVPEVPVLTAAKAVAAGLLPENYDKAFDALSTVDEVKALIAQMEDEKSSYLAGVAGKHSHANGTVYKPGPLHQVVLGREEMERTKLGIGSGQPHDPLFDTLTLEEARAELAQRQGFKKNYGFTDEPVAPPVVAQEPEPLVPPDELGKMPKPLRELVEESDKLEATHRKLRAECDGLDGRRATLTQECAKAERDAAERAIAEVRATFTPTLEALAAERDALSGKVTEAGMKAMDARGQASVFVLKWRMEADARAKADAIKVKRDSLRAILLPLLAARRADYSARVAIHTKNKPLYDQWAPTLHGAKNVHQWTLMVGSILPQSWPAYIRQEMVLKVCVPLHQLQEQDGETLRYLAEVIERGNALASSPDPYGYTNDAARAVIIEALSTGVPAGDPAMLIRMELAGILKAVEAGEPAKPSRSTVIPAGPHVLQGMVNVEGSSQPTSVEHSGLIYDAKEG